MAKHKDFRGVALFTLIAFLYSWPIFFIVDAWLIPQFQQQENETAVLLTAIFGHMLGKLGPAIAAVIMWRRYHKEPLPAWKWSRPRYYLFAVLLMITIWTIPALLGLLFDDSFHLRNPIEPSVWVAIATSLTFLWVAGLGEEVGWTAYLLSRLMPHIGKARALIVAGVIRGLWHLPVLISPLIVRFAGQKPPGGWCSSAVVPHSGMFNSSPFMLATAVSISATVCSSTSVSCIARHSSKVELSR